jgi:pyruvate/2-oxoglutarate dehydrogenase complex dihydrolipoamide dehydrogenase (E3) component
MHRELIIVGNGPAAWAAAEEWSRLKSGRAVVVAPNWPAISAPALSQQGNGRTKESAWKSERDWPADVLAGFVELVDSESRTLTWRNAWGREFQMTFDQLILATGTRPRPLNLGATEARVLRLHEAADLEGWAQLREGQRLIVVGGGLVGAEMVEMGVARGCEVAWWVREDRIWPGVLSPSASQNLLHSAASHGVHVQFHQEIVPGQSIEADAIGLAIGTEPVLPSIKGADLSGITIAGDAAGKGSGWAYAGAAGRAAVQTLCGMEPAAIDAHDFPFRASLFHEKVCGWGQLSKDGASRFAVAEGHVCIEWLESEGGELLGFVTLNFPVKAHWVEQCLAAKALDLNALPLAVADSHLRSTAKRLSLQPPKPC